MYNQNLKTLTFILFCCTIQSCSNSQSSNNESSKPISTPIGQVDSTLENISLGKSKEDSIGSPVNLKFKELSLSIINFFVSDEEKKLTQIQQDTVYLFPELGESMEGKNISITTEQLINLKIEQRFETSVTIMGDGPFCDLDEWKHYYSEWKILKANNKGQFVCDSYPLEERNKFPKIQITELKEMVKKKCGSKYFKQISEIKSPTEYPSTVGISRYFLKLSGKRKDNGLIISKIIIILEPIGC